MCCEQHAHDPEGRLQQARRFPLCFCGRRQDKFRASTIEQRYAEPRILPRSADGYRASEGLPPTCMTTRANGGAADGVSVIMAHEHRLSISGLWPI